MPVNPRALYVSILFMLISGCTNRPVFTVEVLKTPTAVQEDIDVSAPTPSPSPSSAVIPQNTAILEPVSPPTSVVTPVMPSDFSPVLYGKKYDANMFFLLLGAVQGNTWLPADQAVELFAGEWEYDVHTFATRHFPVRGHHPKVSPVTGERYFITTDTTFDDFGMVGTLHDWQTRQGVVQELVPENDVYRQIVLDWLKSRGSSAVEIGTLRIFRVDLEADGVDEIFISASHLDKSQHFTKLGDYSLILMRKVVGNEALTLPIVVNIYRSQKAEMTYPSTYSLGNFIDLNRDGILEVVVDIQRWDGFGAIVYQVDGQNVVERLAVR